MLAPIKDGPPLVKSGTPITEDFFENFLSWPWYVDGVYLDDIPCIYHVYRNHVLSSNTPEEMLKEMELFGWLAWDALRTAKKFVTERNFRRVKMMVQKGQGAGIFTPIILPEIMLKATLISREFDLPEFPAACQYFRARHFRKNKKE